MVSRGSAFTFKGDRVDVREVGAAAQRRRGAGRKRAASGRSRRVSAQLVNSADGYQLWSDSYDRKLADVFALQEELTQAIVGSLPLVAPPSRPRTLVRPSTSATEAYTLYLRGRFEALKRSVPGLTAGIGYFERALERDPGYALAYAALAECWLIRGFEEFGDLAPLEAMPRGKAAVRRALELDPNLAEAHCSSAMASLLFDWDWTTSEASFRRAVELRPDFSIAHTWYAVFLMARGRHDEAIARSQLRGRARPAQRQHPRGRRRMPPLRRPVRGGARPAPGDARAGPRQFRGRWYGRPGRTGCWGVRPTRCPWSSGRSSSGAGCPCCSASWVWCSPFSAAGTRRARCSPSSADSGTLPCVTVFRGRDLRALGVEEECCRACKRMEEARSGIVPFLGDPAWTWHRESERLRDPSAADRGALSSDAARRGRCSRTAPHGGSHPRDGTRPRGSVGGAGGAAGPPDAAGVGARRDSSSPCLPAPGKHWGPSWSPSTPAIKAFPPITR